MGRNVDLNILRERFNYFVIYSVFFIIYIGFSLLVYICVYENSDRNKIGSCVILVWQFGSRISCLIICDEYLFVLFS
jgi:hypothetical protein